MIAKPQEPEQDKIECYYLCERLADRVVTFTDDYGEYIADMYLCPKCHEMVDKDHKRFKWSYLRESA